MLISLLVLHEEYDFFQIACYISEILVKQVRVNQKAGVIQSNLLKDEIPYK